MTRALVLLDIENSSIRAVGGVNGYDEVVVAAAASIGSAGTQPWRRLMPEAARAFPGARVHLELALVPHVPEAADRALERLRDEAGEVATAGDFDEILIVSGDRDVLALAPVWMTRSSRSERCVRAVATGARRHVRSVRRGGYPVEPGTWSPSSPTLPLDADSPLADVANAAIDPLDTLADVVARVEARPELLSLLSLTRGSSAGVARLGTLLSGTTTTLAGTTPACDCEWPWATQAVPRGLRSVESGPAGAGTVRLLWNTEDGRRATTRLTGLPRWIVEASANTVGRVPFRLGNVDDSGVLIAAGALLEGPAVRLVYRPGGGCSPPRLLVDGRDSWWIGTRAQGRVATSKLGLVPSTLRGCGVSRLPPSEKSVAARAIVVHDRATFRADVAFRAVASIAKRIGPGELAWVNVAGDRALLWNPAGARPLAATHVPVAPIQYLVPEIVRTDHLDALLDLPCVVPVATFPIESFFSSVRSGTAPASKSQ